MWRDNILAASLSVLTELSSGRVRPPTGLASLVPAALDPLLVPAPNLTISASLSPTLNTTQAAPSPPSLPPRPLIR